MRIYTELTQEQRYQIHTLMKAGHNQTETAEIVGVHKSMVSRELRCNCGLKGYRPKQTHELALNRRINKAALRITLEQWVLVECLLRDDWSPERISLLLMQENSLSISHEWIYLYIIQDKPHGGDLHHHLLCQKPRKKRCLTYDHCDQLPNRASIEERPAIVEHRTHLGDWVLDTIIGKDYKQVLVSLTEHKSGWALIAKVPTREADDANNAVLSLLATLPNMSTPPLRITVRNLPCVRQSLKCSMLTFTLHTPYASWERGLNINTNGLIHQYFPKGHYFTTITQKEIQIVMDKLNYQSRKYLGMKIPNKVFFSINPPVALAS